MRRSPRTIYLMRIVEMAVRSGIEQRLRDFHLTDFQYTVLSLLKTRDGLSSADLSRRFRNSPQSMNEVIVTLERKAMLAREADPANRRILRLRLTDQGRATLAECDRRVDALEDELFGRLSPREMRTFRQALGAMATQLGHRRRRADRLPAVAATDGEP